MDDTSSRSVRRERGVPLYEGMPEVTGSLTVAATPISLPGLADPRGNSAS